MPRAASRTAACWGRPRESGPLCCELSRCRPLQLAQDVRKHRGQLVISWRRAHAATAVGIVIAVSRLFQFQQTVLLPDVHPQLGAPTTVLLNSKHRNQARPTLCTEARTNQYSVAAPHACAAAVAAAPHAAALPGARARHVRHLARDRHR
eukprot:scaffold65688_cov50-Phaeocystis_antarctica.AAC.2